MIAADDLATSASKSFRGGQKYCCFKYVLLKRFNNDPRCTKKLAPTGTAYFNVFETNSHLSLVACFWGCFVLSIRQLV